MNREVPDVQTGFGKGSGTRDQIANIHCIIENSIPEKHLLLLSWLCQSLWLCRSQKTVENYSRDGNTRPSDLPPGNPCAGQEAIVKSEYRTTDWFQIGKGVHQGSILSTEEPKGERNNLTVIVRDFKPYFQ